MRRQTRSKCTSSLTRRSIYQDKISEKKKQIQDAVDYCKVNKCRGSKALNTGNFPLIKTYKTINRILDGKSPMPSHSKEYCSVLTVEEEGLLVKHMVNKARAYQPFNRKDATKYILTMLKVRQAVNKKVVGGRKFKKLSPAAQNTLKRGSLSRQFWERFDVKYKKVIKKKRRGTTSLKRVQACTKQMAQQHIDGMAQELIDCGIFTDANKIESGCWSGKIDGSRVFNHDETPQFLNYGVDGTASNIFYAAKGERCTGLLAENRECVTISPMISLNGNVPICHVLFASAGIKSNMAPKEAVDAIDNLLISSTENGFQTGKSCLKFYEMFDQYLTDHNIQRPVVVLSDGHSSRFDIDVLRFCQEKKINQFLSPPDTTGLLQPLDQINAKLHTSYRECTKSLFQDDHVNRETFMVLLSKIWSTWAPKDTVIKSFKKCGITEDNLDIEFMQQDKFASADLVTEKESDVDSTPNTSKAPWNIQSPLNVRKETREYWREKYQNLENAMKEAIKLPITPEEISEFTKVEKYKVKTEESKELPYNTSMWESKC